MSVERVKAAFAGLAVLSGKLETLQQEAEWMVLSARISAASDTAQANAGGTAAAIRALEKYARLAVQLRNAVDEMPREAIAALEETKGGKHPWRLQADLKCAVRNAADALEALEAGQPTAGPKGRRRKRSAAQIAEAAARVYERLTGERAAVRVQADTGQAYGPYLEMLRAIFAALEIDASAEAQAKKRTAGGNQKMRPSEPH